MARKRDDESRLEQGRHDTEIRRDTAVRGSMGTPASGTGGQKVTPESDSFRDQPGSQPESERVRGNAQSEPNRSSSGPRKLPLPD
jgi:hypothetical protein